MLHNWMNLMKTKDDYLIRLATPGDALGISLLYHKVYDGKYPDPLMREKALLLAFLASPHSLWVVAEKGGEIVCSVVYEVDAANRLGKTFGGAVLRECRGAGLLERALDFGFKALTLNSENAVEAVYATTRTATIAPQIVTEKLGYRRLGIFPNIHRTDAYETHCLVALFANGALAKRFTKFLLHPDIAELYKIVQRECGLPELALATQPDVQAAAAAVVQDAEEFPLEIIDGHKYVLHRFRGLIDSGQLPFHFYPFHEPNVMVCSPCDQIQVFLHLATVDKYCTIVGIRKPPSHGTQRLLEVTSKVLRERGVRYIETIVRADKLGTIDGILNAGFVPCAYFPAFQVQDEMRHDYIVLSKTFEILDFSNIELAGANKEYLLHYFTKWKERVLDRALRERS